MGVKPPAQLDGPSCTCIDSFTCASADSEPVSDSTACLAGTSGSLETDVAVEEANWLIWFCSVLVDTVPDWESLSLGVKQSAQLDASPCSCILSVIAGADPDTFSATAVLDEMSGLAALRCDGEIHGVPVSSVVVRSRAALGERPKLVQCVVARGGIRLR